MRHDWRWVWAASCAVVMSLSGEALAYRPFDSTDADVAKPLELELELGPLDYLVIGQASWLAVPNVVVNLGVVPGLEAVLEGQQFIRLGPTGGLPRVSLEATALQLKGMLRNGSLQEAPGPSIAVEGSLLLPTVNDGPGVGGELAIIVSQRFAATTLSLNGGVLLTRAGNFGLDGGLIVEGPNSWTLRPVAEVLVEYEASVGTILSCLVGAILRIDENLTLDMALRGGRDESHALAEFRAGLTWTIPL